MRDWNFVPLIRPTTAGRGRIRRVREARYKPISAHDLCILNLSFFSPLSEDYGKNFKDITNLINNTFIRTEFGMAIGPENSGKVRPFICVQNCIIP